MCWAYFPLRQHSEKADNRAESLFPSFWVSVGLLDTLRTPLFNQCNIVSHGHTDLTHHWVFTLHFHTLQIQGCVTCVLFGRQGLHSSRASLALLLNAGKIASYAVNVSTSPNISVLWHFLTLVHKIKFYGFQTNALRCRLVPNTSTSRRSP